MSSFYGGKQGRTYHIVARYDSVQAMVEQFQKGGAYTEANYGEYVLIDTVFNNSQRGNPQNGLLFRRGFNYLEESRLMPSKSDYNDQFGNFQQEQYQEAWKTWVKAPGGGAIYVGQIVGPEGRTPELIIQDWEDFEAQLENSSGFSGHSTVSMNHPGFIKNNNQYIYNDQIDAGYINILDENDNIIGGYIAFDIPTPVFNITAQSVDAYGEEKLSKNNIEGTSSSTYQIGSTYDSINKKWKYDGLIYEQPESKDHSFYHNFDIAVPKGVHGQNIQSIEVDTIENINSDIMAGTSPGSTITIDGVNVQEGDQYLTYTIRNFDESAAGASTAHLGRWPYRVINEITSVEGQRAIISDPVVGQSIAKGQIIFLDSSQDPYSNNSRLVAICVKEGRYQQWDEDEFYPGMSIEFYDDPNDPSDDIANWLVSEIPATAAAGLLNVDYKAGKSDQVNFRQVDFIYIDPIGGMYVVYSDEPGVAYYLTQVDSIADIERGYTQNDLDKGSIIIHHKNGTSQEFFIKQIENIFINEDITKSQDIVATYKGISSDEDTEDGTLDYRISQSIGTINNILDIQRIGDSIIVLYYDPQVRKNIPTYNQVRRVWKEYLREADDPNDYNGGLIWYNFGPLGSQYHIQGMYNFNDITIGDNLPYPNQSRINISMGLETVEQTQNRAGWIITIPDKVQVEEDGELTTVEIQRIFAYDYNNDTEEGSHQIQINDTAAEVNPIRSNWYEIMSSMAGSNPPQNYLVISEDVEEQGVAQFFQSRDSLIENGIWFVVTGGHDNG